MKLLANENFPLDSVQWLKNAGFDVTYVATDYPGIADDAVMKIAQKEQRTILTFDKDYGELIFKQGYKNDKGVIFLRLSEFESDEPGKIVERLLNNPSFSADKKLTVFDGQFIRQKGY